VAADARWTTDWREALQHEVDAVVVATHNTALAEIACAAAASGRHVLCEKPLGRNAIEAEAVVAASADAGRVLKVGFNHRHHPAIARAHDALVRGAIGTPFAIRGAYGHGGRPGYEREWRADPRLAGGGELLDQGVHLIDLSRWFLGEFSVVSAVLGTWYWPIAPLEDNAFAMLATADGRAASLHTSWTQWRNLFRFEVMGSDGYLRMEGLGGSYGTERLTIGRRQPQSGPPLEEGTSFEGPDPSWTDEWVEFKNAISESREPLGSGGDGLAAARLIDALYESSTQQRLVVLG
jgi:predicted dehydrogenase